MWGLNRGDWPWLLLGLLGAIVAGGTPPSEGTFIAQVQVKENASRRSSSFFREEYRTLLSVTPVITIVFRSSPKVTLGSRSPVHCCTQQLDVMSTVVSRYPGGLRGVPR